MLVGPRHPSHASHRARPRVHTPGDLHLRHLCLHLRHLRLQLRLRLRLCLRLSLRLCLRLSLSQRRGGDRVLGAQFPQQLVPLRRPTY